MVYRVSFRTGKVVLSQNSQNPNQTNIKNQTKTTTIKLKNPTQQYGLMNAQAFAAKPDAGSQNPGDGQRELIPDHFSLPFVGVSTQIHT